MPAAKTAPRLAEQVIDERCDGVRDRVGIEIVVERVVTDVPTETDRRSGATYGGSARCFDRKGRRYATIAPEHRRCEERRGEPERRVAVCQHQEGSGIPQFNDLEVHVASVDRISESISKFLASPDRWEPATEDETEKERAVAAVQQAVSTELHRFVPDVLLTEPRPDWLAAFDFKGYGSTGRRARRIQTIYETAAPIPAEPLGPGAAEFLRAVRVLVYEAIDAAGGRLVSEVIG